MLGLVDLLTIHYVQLFFLYTFVVIVTDWVIGIYFNFVVKTAQMVQKSSPNFHNQPTKKN